MISIIKHYVMLSKFNTFHHPNPNIYSVTTHQLNIILNTNTNTRIILEYIHSYYTPYIYYAMRLHACGTDYFVNI